MKTLKTITAALLTVVSFSAFSADGSKLEKLNMSYAAQTYVDAMTHGKIEALPEVLDKEIKYTTTNGDRILNFNKAEMLKSLEGIQNVEQNCTTEYSVVETTPTISVVKVTMKYEGFSKITYLNLANTSKGWKITSISTSFI
ncbi:Putative lumazine-binding [Daejeonella rubra]|uniref:Putative lumazine-binding n=1 Tax=Daejeonella rubra TaxID=990371 RepID=A0A1G9ZD73_9SPHI|nr:nuclear transport factor 2 family protein [Daejeonella rubra]SDN19077.1 Putative lumazine-binding [Daejeonella rubra]